MTDVLIPDVPFGNVFDSLLIGNREILLGWKIDIICFIYELCHLLIASLAQLFFSLAMTSTPAIETEKLALLIT